jgi:hypothetical protein
MRVLVLAVCLAMPAVVVAQPAPTPDEADRLLDEGTRLFAEEADYDGAMQAFQRSYQLRPSWKALNGIALVYQQQGRYVEAIETYERLLGEFGSTLSEGQTSTVKKRIAELEKRVVVLEVDVRQPGARVTVDGREVGVGPWKGRVRLLPGEHVVVATLEGHRTLDKHVVVEPGGQTALTIELEPEQVKVVVKEKPVRFERRLPAWVPWATMGAGVGLAVVGGGLHALAASDFDAFDESVADEAAMNPMCGIATCPADGDPDLKDRAELEQTAAISLYVVGGAALATGAVLLYVNQPRPVRERDGAGAASVTPIVGPDVAGVGVTIRY